MTYAGLSHPVLIALCTAASQLEPTFSLGELSAGADAACDPSGMTANTIVVGKAEAARFT